MLIIEDEPLIALDLEDLLAHSGALSFSFADAQQAAIDAARERRPDFILSDVSLIEGTGPFAVQAILNEHGLIPVIFVTATPLQCTPCPPASVIFRKPLNRPAIAAAFREMTVPA